MAETTPINANGAELDALLSEREGPVLVDLWAPWCAPCRAIAPALEKIAEQYAGRATIAKVNIDDSPEVARRLGVSSIPTLILFDGGSEAARLVGVQSEAALARAIESALTISPSVERNSRARANCSVGNDTKDPATRSLPADWLSATRRYCSRTKSANTSEKIWSSITYPRRSRLRRASP